MKYLSTRSVGQGLPFSDVLLAGLAPDGGLYLPEKYPVLGIDDLDRFRSVFNESGYSGLAVEVLKLFIDDISEADLARIAEAAYGGGKFIASGANRAQSENLVAPISNITGQLYLQHLSYGPTAAFKDMAMQLLGELMSFELGRRGDFITILGATSGDTGSAAEYALLDKGNIKVFMLSPAGRMTPFQQAQMYSICDPRVVNLAVEGVFDDCQDLVKAVNADTDFKTKYHIGAVNSINWARLLAQVVYYIAGWIQASKSASDQVSFTVPSGNFGNVCAGHIAKQMGLPIKRLVVATNENNVLDEFFKTGVYRVRSSSQCFATSSPSMDISKASNFERFIFDLFDRDTAKVADLFGTQIPQNGFFDISKTDQFASVESNYGFVSGSSTHADRLANIRWCYEKSQIVIDPHTADGVKVARQYLGEEPMLVLETALPVKFAETIMEALGAQPEMPARFANLADSERFVRQIPADLALLKQIIADSYC